MERAGIAEEDRIPENEAGEGGLEERLKEDRGANDLGVVRGLKRELNMMKG